MSLPVHPTDAGSQGFGNRFFDRKAAGQVIVLILGFSQLGRGEHTL